MKYGIRTRIYLLRDCCVTNGCPVVTVHHVV